MASDRPTEVEVEGEDGLGVESGLGGFSPPCTWRDHELCAIWVWFRTSSNGRG